jgi:hypothetical protein
MARRSRLTTSEINRHVPRVRRHATSLLVLHVMGHAQMQHGPKFCLHMSVQVVGEWGVVSWCCVCEIVVFVLLL